VTEEDCCALSPPPLPLDLSCRSGEGAACGRLTIRFLPRLQQGRSSILWSVNCPARVAGPLALPPLAQARKSTKKCKRRPHTRRLEREVRRVGYYFLLPDELFWPLSLLDPDFEPPPFPPLLPPLASLRLSSHRESEIGGERRSRKLEPAIGAGLKYALDEALGGVPGSDRKDSRRNTGYG
jgi:hypothetical protein